MARLERSLRITDAYRDRLIALSERIGAYTAALWARIDVEDLDRGHEAWLVATVAALEQAQRAGLRLTAAYVASFIGSELDRRASELPLVDEQRFAGTLADGRALEVPLAKTLIGAKAAIGDGKAPEEALGEQGHRAVRLASSAVLAAPRGALMDQVATHPEIVGWRRVTRGGCGACLAAAAHGYQRHEPLRVHDHCRCTAEPVIRGVSELARRATGPEIFAAMSRETQDTALGPAAAQAIREGRVAWPQLIATSPMVVGPDMLTQAPLGAAA